MFLVGIQSNVGAFPCFQTVVYRTLASAEVGAGQDYRVKSMKAESIHIYQITDTVCALVKIGYPEGIKWVDPLKDRTDKEHIR